MFSLRTVGCTLLRNRIECLGSLNTAFTGRRIILHRRATTHHSQCYSVPRQGQTNYSTHTRVRTRTATLTKNLIVLCTVVYSRIVVYTTVYSTPLVHLCGYFCRSHASTAVSSSKGCTASRLSSEQRAIEATTVHMDRVNTSSMCCL